MILATLVRGVIFGAGGDGKWVTDWPNLSETGHMVTAARMEGVVEPGKNQSYQVNVATKIVSSGELKKSAEVKYYGLNRRGPDALNTQVTSLELVFGNDKMEVPTIALGDILNPLIGERMEMVFSEDKKHIRAIVINGPDGAEGYMVAFIFEDGKFCRRQIRSNTATANGWPLIEDKRYQS